MITITLKDGKQLSFDKAITIFEIAEAISRRLAKEAIAGILNGILVDLSHLVEKDANIIILTSNDAEGLEVIRHSTAHLLAHAVKILFPVAQPTIGPVIEDGFYYDFYYPPKFTEADLEKIEQKMQELAKANLKIERLVVSRHDAISMFEKLGETYKIKLIEAIPGNADVTVYRQQDFVDLCRGPHVPSTGFLRAFKLTKLSGAYWRGNSANEMLQRIYGTAWPTKALLDEYLSKLEQAKLRDHRIIAKKMDLFHLQEEAPGMVFWHPNGWAIFSELKRYISMQLQKFGYSEICTPQLIDRSLWEQSGHWEKFKEVMFITESENRTYAIKPMSCPGHVQVFKQGIKSYRDLPIRYAEFGCCHRNEHSGTLHGILRVRGFTQDDAHIFCTNDQIAPESAAYIDQLLEVYADLGFKNIIMRVATRPAKRIGADEIWDMAEKSLCDVLNQKGLTWELAAGEGAFYGPKIEFSLRDCLGRVWQCGTLQVDLSMPERLGAYYIAEDGNKRVPVMLHRAMLGSLERFVGILLEETGGNLPVWLAPVQAVVMNITDQQVEYVRKITEKLAIFGFRVRSDLRNEKISFKIREHTIGRVPYILVAGNREVENQMVSVRNRKGEDLGQMSVEGFIEMLEKEILRRSK